MGKGVPGYVVAIIVFVIIIAVIATFSYLCHEFKYCCEDEEGMKNYWNVKWGHSLTTVFANLFFRCTHKGVNRPRRMVCGVFRGSLFGIL